MKASDLTETERLALMALLKLAISADEQLSEGESKVLLRIADEMGRGAFKAVREQAQGTLKTFDDLKRAVAAVHRPEARRMLYQCALDAAQADALVAKERERLNWVAQQWDLDVDPRTAKLR